MNIQSDIQERIEKAENLDEIKNLLHELSLEIKSINAKQDLHNNLLKELTKINGVEKQQEDLKNQKPMEVQDE